MPGVMRTLGARFKLEGEDEFKNVVSQLNAGARTLRSEMNLLQAQYQGNTDSVEFLTEKSELLGRMLDQQKEKTAATQKMLESAAKAYAKAQEEAAQAAGKSKEEQDKANAALRDADQVMQKYAAALNNAQAEEYNLQHQIDETNAALQGQGEEMVGLGDTVSNLTEKFGVHLPQGITNALNSMNSFSAGTVAAMAGAAAAIAGVAAGVKALFETTLESAQKADDLLTKSAITNLSTTLLQELEYASSMIDVDVETITGSMSKLTTKIADAAGGNEGLKESFRSLGVSITEADGSLRSSEDVFFDVIDALGEMGNDTERDAMAMSLLGKSAQDLNPLIKQGTGTLKEYMAAADENFVLTEDEIKALGDLSDQVEENKKRWEAIKMELSAQFAPIATKVLETFGKLVEKAGKALIDSGLIQGIGEILGLLLDMFSPLIDLLDTSDEVPGRLQPVYAILHSIAMVLATIADFVDVLRGLLPQNWGSGISRTALGWNINSGQMSHVQQLKYNGTGWEQDPVTGMWKANGAPGLNAIGTDNWRGGLTWAGENGPELVELPAGSQIHSAQESRSFGGDTFYITIDAKSVKEFNDIVEMAHSARSDSWMR